MDGRITRADVADVAAEVLHVNGIEAHDRDVQPHVGFGELGAEVVGAGGGGEVVFNAVEGSEEVGDVDFVDGLFADDADFVDAVVDVVVGPFVSFFDLGTQGLGEEVEGGVVLREEVVEFGVHHADDLAGFVVDDLVCFGVVEDGDGEAAGEFGVDGEVEVAEPCAVGV